MAEFIRFNSTLDDVSKSNPIIILNLDNIEKVWYSKYDTGRSELIITMTNSNFEIIEVDELSDKLYAKLSKISSEI